MPHISPARTQFEIGKAAVRITVHLWRVSPPELHKRIQARVEMELGEMCAALWSSFDLEAWTTEVRKGLAAARRRAAEKGLGWDSPKASIPQPTDNVAE